MPCDACQKKIADLEEENRKLRIKVRQLSDKLYDRNRQLNRMHRDSYESVDFGNGYDDR